MKRYNPILTKMTRLLSMVFVSLLMLGYVTSCSEQDTQGNAAAEEAYLNLSFSTSSPTVTRAGDSSLGNDETNAYPSTESDIHSIKVWVFMSGSGDDALPLSYKEEQLSQAINGSYTLSLRILRKVNNEDLKNIDLYILTNSESTNMAEKLKDKTSMKLVTRKELQDLTFSTPFGITSEGKAETTSVPEKGLPISRAIKNISVEGHVAETETEAAEKAITIPLVRAVSKLHFYFARKKDANTEEVKVTKIEIDGNTFPVNGFAFPDEEEYNDVANNKNATSNKYTETSQYVNTVLTLDGVENSGIKEVEDPTSYDKKTDETAQTYMDRMNKDLGGHDLCYLRETNKTIKGKIYYELASGSDEKSAEFNIPSSGNAIRNRELVVYGYFPEGGSLCLDSQVLPWSKVSSEIGWKAECQMYAWTTGTPNPQDGDEEGVLCFVNYPRYTNGKHEALVNKSSAAGFYVKVSGAAGLVWKAHLTNEDEFTFNYGSSTNNTNCVSTGIARTNPYQVRVEAKNAWTTGTDWNSELTDWAKAKGTNPVYTDLYITVSLDGIHEYEVEINPDNANGMYKYGRKFAGTNTRIRIFQLQAKEKISYADLQKNSGLYTNYLKN